MQYMRNIWTTCFILQNMTLRDQQMTETDFLEQEEARNQIAEGESILAVIPIDVSDDDNDPASDPPEDTEDLSSSDPEDDSVPAPRRNGGTRMRQMTRLITRRVLTGGFVP